MEQNSEKRTLIEDWKLLKRGIRLALEISPQYFIYNLLFQIALHITPYFSLTMSTCFVNELAGACRPGRLTSLAAITVAGVFSISAARRLLQLKRNTWNELFSRQLEIYLFTHQHGLAFEHLENPEISLMREKIFADQNTNGNGLLAVFWDISQLASEIADMAVSASLTFSIFRLASDVQLTGFLAFVNTPYCACLLGAILFLNVVLTAKAASARMKKERDALSSLASENVFFHTVYNSVHGEDVSIFNLKNILIKEYQKRARPAWILKLEKATIQFEVIAVLQKWLPDLAILMVTAAKAFTGVFGIGNFILYRGTISRFTTAVLQFAGNFTKLRENNKYLLHLYQFLDLPDDMYHGTLAVEKRDDLDYEIEFRDVSFRYPGTEAYVLRNVNMKFCIGDKLAIVGENGSGKTTFIKLLCRLYDPTEGKILLNGIDITRYRYEEYLSLFSVVFQDYRLFQFSLSDNVAASLAPDAAKVERCLVQAGFDDRLAGLEKGIETVLGRDFENDGIDLSGGEEQKVALARALYKDAPFVILDEPTAALDPIAEAAVYENFQRLVEHKTAVFISHRLSSCRFCDDIIVFDKGCLVQRGGHEALVGLEGKYRELWNAQAQYYA